LCRFWLHLVNSSNARIRSKARFLIGRRVQNPKWFKEHLHAMDPRVRANIVEALWGVDSPEMLSILWQATKDSNNRVPGNAMFGLHMLADPAVIPLHL